MTALKALGNFGFFIGRAVFVGSQSFSQFAHRATVRQNGLHR
jgi:hypothetical protein